MAIGNGKRADLYARYAAAMHRMQSAVAHMIAQLGLKGAGADPKRLRVGVNSALADHGALVKLLVAKGVFTEDEYGQAIVEGAESEAEARVADARRTCGLPDTVDFA